VSILCTMEVGAVFVGRVRRTCWIDGVDGGTESEEEVDAAERREDVLRAGEGERVEVLEYLLRVDEGVNGGVER